MNDPKEKDKSIEKLIFEWMVVLLTKKNSKEGSEGNASSISNQNKIDDIREKLRKTPREVLINYLFSANLMAAEEEIVEFLEEITGEEISTRKLLIKNGLLVEPEHLRQNSGSGGWELDDY